MVLPRKNGISKPRPFQKHCCPLPHPRRIAYPAVAIKLTPAMSNRPAATRDTATGESFSG